VNTYSPDTLAAAWHLPNFEMNINAKYRLLDDKLTLKGELYNAGGISYLDENGDQQNTGALFDLNFGAEYQINDKIGLFVDLNNVTNQKFQRWYKYPNFGFNMMGGITVKF
jgi:outer membrane receptor protein involved in Fe transport